MQTHDQTVLITGGSSGIGLALVRKFAHANRVIAVGRDRQRLESVKAEFPAVEIATADLADPHAIEALARRYSDVSVLINNAGVQYLMDFAATPDSAQLASEVTTNLLAPMLLCQSFIPHLLAKPQAAIVNVSSGLGFVPKQSAPSYCATKSGLHMFTKALRWQLEAHRIRVFEVIPALVDTPMTAGRGSGKITPEALVEEFWRCFERDRYEIPIGKTALLLRMNRWMPRLAERMMRYR